jgi:cilia- and flagella-associated protein 57
MSRIISMTASSRGIIVGGEEGKIWVYESVTSEHVSPLRLTHTNHEIKFENEKDPILADNTQEKNARITSLALSKSEDRLYLMTDTRQLIQVQNISLDGSDVENFQFRYMISPFHSSAITGLDVCLRKQLIVTCSAQMINVWNYNTMRLEISERPLEEP